MPRTRSTPLGLDAKEVNVSDVEERDGEDAGEEVATTPGRRTTSLPESGPSAQGRRHAGRRSPEPGRLGRARGTADNRPTRLFPRDLRAPRKWVCSAAGRNLQRNPLKTLNSRYQECTHRARRGTWGEQTNHPGGRTPARSPNPEPGSGATRVLPRPELSRRHPFRPFSGSNLTGPWSLDTMFTSNLLISFQLTIRVSLIYLPPSSMWRDQDRAGRPEAHFHRAACLQRVRYIVLHCEHRPK